MKFQSEAPDVLPYILFQALIHPESNAMRFLGPRLSSLPAHHRFVCAGSNLAQ